MLCINRFDRQRMLLMIRTIVKNQAEKESRLSLHVAFFFGPQAGDIFGSSSIKQCLAHKINLQPKDMILPG